MSSTEDVESPRDTTDENDPEYPKPLQRVVIMSALYLTIFLVNLDQNIISTAIPAITNQFQSLDDVASYGSAYLLTTCSLQLLTGKVYKYYHAKAVFLISCTVFEIGSTICGAAPNSMALIIGRAVAGMGSCGIYAGVMVIMFYTIPIQQRPIYQSVFAAIFAIASVVGPLIGGVLTDKVTWRWCFFINLPVGAASMLVTACILHLPNQKLESRAVGWIAKCRQLDPLGTLVFLPGIICLLLALHRGGITHPWNDGRIIVLLVLCVILLSSFVGIQIWKQEDATVPPRIVKQRSVTAAIWFGFFNGASLIAVTYYLPIWFQAIKGVNAVTSATMLLPIVISTAVAAILTGVVTPRVGYYSPFFILSSIVMPIGAGLLTTLAPTSSRAEWIGYQVIFGLGLGVGVSLSILVVQTVLKQQDIAIGSTLAMFSRFLGMAVSLSIAENVFLSTLVTKLVSIPGFSRTSIIEGGASDLRDKVHDESELITLLSDYNLAITHVFHMVVITSSLTVFGSLLVEWRSLKSRVRARQDDDKSTDKTITRLQEIEKPAGAAVSISK